MKVVMSDHGCSAEIEGDCAICEVNRLRGENKDMLRTLTSIEVGHTGPALLARMALERVGVTIQKRGLGKQGHG